MRIGISSYTYGWAVSNTANPTVRSLTALDLIDRAAGFSCVRVLQLADNMPADTWLDDSLALIRSEADRRKIDLEVGTRGCKPDLVVRFLDIAARLRSPILRIVLDLNEDEPTLDEAVYRLSGVTGYADQLGITIAIENHDRFGADELIEVINRLSSTRVGVCLDTANCIGAIEAPETVVEKLGPYCVNLHIKDFVIRRVVGLQGFVVEGRPLGEGRLNVPWVISRLESMGKSDITAVVELWVPPEDRFNDTITKESLWAEKSVHTLSRWIQSSHVS
ncbi:MAG: endonuclease [Phycisphaerae bacterium]|jgi:sugar phosphate isomerase/epimerase|nr:MAG: endonuclease [Phycisphaerae bacterium]